MKVQLVFAPPKGRARMSDLVERIYPPLGILYIAAYLRKFLPDLELKITDGLLFGWDHALGEIGKFAPDILFVSYITPCATSAYQLSREVKRRLPGIVAVFGGPHATALPLEPFEKADADFVVAGEGEETSLQLVRAILDKKGRFDHIEGLYWRHEDQIVNNAARPFIKDLDTIPFPARDLIDMKDYRGWFVHKASPETSVLFSRGCPYNCTFCTNAVWKSAKPWMRLRSPGNIADEMEALKNLGIREVFDNSDEFNCSSKFALAICEELKARKLGMTWKAQLRTSPLSEELARAMAEAGCWYVHLGIESGNERTLKGINKNISLEEVLPACRLLKKYGIKVFGLFMLFNAWEEDGKFVFEGIDETRKTLEFAQDLIDKKLLDYMSCSITTPYPGSQLFEIARRHGLIKEELVEDWNRWLTEESFIMDLPGLERAEASRLYFRGSLLRGYCCLKSGNWSLKDVPLFAGKFFKAMLMRMGGE